MKLHTLYLCYFWLNEPLVQTQVLPYLRELLRDGIKVSLLTFEREMSKNWTAETIAAKRRELAAEGIDWYCLPYHKSPTVPATLYDVYNGARLARRIIKEKGVNVLHARVHVPAMMGAIVKKLSRGNLKMIFDIRGFMPEEYTDVGHWKKDGALYKTVKAAERRLLKNSDGFVVLTEKARDILFPESRGTERDKYNRPVEVIPCCVDLKRFENATPLTRSRMRQQLSVENRRVVAYAGSFGTWYLADEMFDFLAAAHRHNPKTFALILTKNSVEEVRPKLLEKGFTDADFFIARVSPAEVPDYLCAADVALSFIKACYSKLSSSPTKVAEYLACGVPVICNPGVGDVDELINTEQVGIILNGFSAQNYIEALQQVEQLQRESDLTERCRRVARNRFDLEKVGGRRYRNLYHRLQTLD